MSFKKKLQELRLANHMTQQDVADYIHVARSTIAGYETKGRQPSHEKLAAIADLFNVPVDYLLNDDNVISISPSKITTKSDDELILLLSYRNLSRASKRDLQKYLKLLKTREQHP